MADLKETLIRAFQNAEREVSRSRQLVQTSRQKILDAEKKIDLINETKERAAAAKASMPELETRVGELDRLLAKVESLAASENSRQNATPEVRAKNREIEQALEQVQKDERTATQLLTDCSFLETEIESSRSEFEERKSAATIRLGTVYKNIQEIRHELANTRRERLSSYLERQQKHANVEIEFVKLTTHVLVYRSLTGSVQLELNALNSRDESALANLRREVEKVESMIRQIQPHTVISEAELRQIQVNCETYLKEITQTEALLKDNIIRMSQLENIQDELSKEIQKAEDMNEQLREAVQAAEGATPDLEQEVETSKTRAQTSAQAEIANLTQQVHSARADAEAAARRLEARKSELKDQRVPKETETMISRIQKERIRVEERTRQLQSDRLNVVAMAARRSNTNSPVPGTTEDDELG
jgi:chromosome segregation ATPase